VILALVLASFAAAATPAEAQARAKQILADDYQTDLPRDDTESESTAQKGGAPPRRGPRRPRKVIETGDAGPGAAPITRMLLWVILGGAVLLLLAFVISELRGRGGGPEPVAGAPGADEASDAALTEKPLDDADELARQGRYGEAIRVLLLRTLAELARRVAVPASQTSREILSQADVPDPAREALRSLVNAVEISHFGGAVPAAGDYHACVDRFRAFVDAYRAVPAAA
jgi:hypothetical protein